MFDWVGGRTSEMSAVGLLPAALQVLEELCIFHIIELVVSLYNVLSIILLTSGH